MIINACSYVADFPGRSYITLLKFEEVFKSTTCHSYITLPYCGHWVSPEVLGFHLIGVLIILTTNLPSVPGYVSGFVILIEVVPVGKFSTTIFPTAGVCVFVSVVAYHQTLSELYSYTGQPLNFYRQTVYKHPGNIT